MIRGPTNQVSSLRMSAHTAESRVRPLSPITEVQSRAPPTLPYFRSTNLDELMTDDDSENPPREPTPQYNTQSVDNCLTCRQVGNKPEMFHCSECLHDFHPPCISAYPVQSTDDIRFRLFICSPCAIDKSRRSRLPRKCKKQWSSDSD